MHNTQQTGNASQNGKLYATPPKSFGLRHNTEILLILPGMTMQIFRGTS